MPELPEVETIKRGLGPLIMKKKIVKVDVDAQTRKAFQGDEANVVDATVTAVRRRGKALLIDLDNHYTMMIHLRMTGQLIWRDSSFLQTSSLESASDSSLCSKYGVARSSTLPRISSKNTSPREILDEGEYDEIMQHQFAAGHPSKNFTAALPNSQTRVTFEFEDGNLFFNDQRKFGFVKVLPTGEVEQDSFIASLAKEPWEMETQELFSQCQRHAKSPIKAVLLDQKVIAGLGNIYADESLFYAGVHPATRAGDLNEEQVEMILEGARSVMLESIDSGGSTMATYIKPDGTTGDYLEMFAKVFHRDGQPCERCGEIILKTKVAGRGTHYCPVCQKEPQDSSFLRTSSLEPASAPSPYQKYGSVRSSTLPRTSSKNAESLRDGVTSNSLIVSSSEDGAVDDNNGR